MALGAAASTSLPFWWCVKNASANLQLCIDKNIKNAKKMSKSFPSLNQSGKSAISFQFWSQIVY